MQGRRVTVFGGSGFVGRYIVKRLAKAGALVRVAVRDPEGAKFLKPMGALGQISFYGIDIGDAGDVAAAVAGSDDVIISVGVLAESGRQSFRRLHVDGPAAVAAAAASEGVERLVHISAIGANAESESRYARSKAMGEAAVSAAFPAASILRPSVIFGPEDDFLNRFAAMARMAPALPLIDGGDTKFQPVYVGDVADAVMAALQDANAAGKTFELGGPAVLTLKEIFEYIMDETGRKRALAPAPARLLRPFAGLLELLPEPPLTRDQLLLLGVDNVVADGAAGLDALGVTPTALAAVAPTYLARYRDGGQFARRRA